MLRKWSLTLAAALVATVTLGQGALDISNFGKASYALEGSDYVVDLANLGNFKCQGTVSPLNLETTVQVEDLRNMPGYDVLSNVGLTELRLKIDTLGVTLAGRANTEKSLKQVCAAFGIAAPWVDVTVMVTPQGMEFLAELDFGQQPIKLVISQDLGTHFSTQKIRFSATARLGSKSEAMINVDANLKICPSKADPELQTVLSLGYNLKTFEITCAGTMNDTWTDPFGMEQLLHGRENMLSIKNAAVAIGWVPGSAVPTSIGIATEKVDFAGFDFGFASTIVPLSKEIAFEAHKDSMSSGEFKRYIQRAVGLDLQNLLSDSIYVKHIQVLFSPAGGKVGKFVLEQGFELTGQLIYPGAMNGSLRMHASRNSNSFMEMNLESADVYQLFKTYISNMENKAKQKALDLIADKLTISRVYQYIEVNSKNEIAIKSECDLVLYGKEKKIQFAGALSPQSVVNQIVNGLVDNALENLKESEE